jgi:uncharacterized membrane protein
VAFCSKCGTNVNDGVAFCPQCGAAVGAAATPPYTSVPPYGNTPPPQYPPYSAPATGSGLQENVAALLSYLAFFVTGIIFLLIDKRPFVRFHAAQSLVWFGGLFIIRIVLAFALIGTFGFGLIHLLIIMCFGLAWWISWIVLMVLSYQGKNFEIPIVAGIARSVMGKVQ